MSTVPEEFRSTTPFRLREMAQRAAPNMRPAVQHALLEAANEIESSEHAYGAIVDQKRALQVELARAQQNLRTAHDVIARLQRGEKF